MTRFEEKIAIVTGAGSGIGRSVARRVVAEGGGVLAVDLNVSDLDETAQLAGANLVPFPSDVTDEGASEAIVAA